jgi:hypothetical protein
VAVASTFSTTIGPVAFDIAAPGVAVTSLDTGPLASELLVDFTGDGSFSANTTETGSPARVAGQWYQFNSCAIRSAATLTVALC